jgi:hypothetical protein
MRAVAAVLGALASVPAGAAAATDQDFTVSCNFDPDQSGTDRNGTVADGLGGSGVSVQFDLANAIARFRDGGTVHLTAVSADAIEFQEKEYTVTFHRDSGDLISHDNKTGYDGTFHCVRIPGRN